MLAEITLTYKLEHETPDYTTSVEASCPTELSNMAHALLKESGAELVNFHFVDKEDHV